MSENSFGNEFVRDLIDRAISGVSLVEVPGADGGPHLTIDSVADASVEAGWLRLWRGDGATKVDRMIHFRLTSGPVDTQLFFLFGRPESVMPHFHAQVVQFSPEACVFNADWMPRLDPVDHPEYFTEVFKPITKAYWKAINNRDNICALAPANPAIAAYLAPWSIGTGRPTTRQELDEVGPNIVAFLDHYLDLAAHIAYTGPDPKALRARDQKHLQAFFADELDPRAWKGVYGVIGEAAGQQVKEIFKTPLRNS
jgi:hypothetical protein